jgi:DNA-directed RNA polymerase specialized sigma24 family protein
VSRSIETADVADTLPTRIQAAPDREAAFVALADVHLDRAYRLARAILRDAVEAQDATHDAFVRAWQHWDTLRDPGRFEVWFDRIWSTPAATGCAAAGRDPPTSRPRSRS